MVLPLVLLAVLHTKSFALIDPSACKLDHSGLYATFCSGRKTI